MSHFSGFLSSGNPRSLFAAFIYFDTSFMVWVLLGALGNFVASEMGLNGTQKGLMTALPVLSGALLRLPMGIAADRFGSRPVGIACLSLTLLPLAIGWLLADSLQVVYLVGILLGVAGASFAVACHWPAAGTLHNTRAWRSESPAPATVAPFSHRCLRLGWRTCSAGKRSSASPCCRSCSRWPSSS